MENKSLAEPEGYLWKGLRFGRLLLIIVIVTWLFKSCLFSVYYIPSGSMSPTLKPGDYVLISKFTYNLRSPEYYPLTGIQFPYFSLDEISEVRRGDIIVFDLPLFPAELHPAQKEDYIKRCTGLPGDTVAVYKGRYFLKQKESLANNVSQIPSDSSAVVLTIPEKMASIQLLESTEPFWESIIMRDGSDVTFDSPGDVLVNGKQRKRYQVKQDYYFVRGDNPRFSSDSRSWGLVPKSNLIGRAKAKIWPWPPKWLE